MTAMQPPISTTRRIWAIVCRSPLAMVFALIAVALWVETLFVVSVDPYDAFPWGITVKLAPRYYSPEQVPYLLNLLAKDPQIDTILIGGSTAVPLTREKLKRIPGVHMPFNFSYSGPRPADMRLVEQTLLARSRARHILVEFGWVFLLDEGDRSTHFPYFLYEVDPLGWPKMVNLSALKTASLLALHGGTFPSDGIGSYIAGRQAMYAAFQTHSNQMDLARNVQRYRGMIDTGTSPDCSRWHTLTDDLVPFVKAELRRGVSVDIIIPAYSLASYYDVSDGHIYSKINHNILGETLASRRCAVFALAGLPHTRVFAFDNDDWITGDIRNYRDSAHLWNPAVADFIVKSVANGDHQLDKGNFDRYAETLRKRVIAYGENPVAH